MVSICVACLGLFFANHASAETCCSGIYPSPFAAGDVSCPTFTPDFPISWMAFNSQITCTAGTSCQLMSCVGTWIPIGSVNGTSIPYYGGGCASSLTSLLNTANSAKQVKWWGAHAQLYYSSCVAASSSQPPPTTALVRLHYAMISSHL